MKTIEHRPPATAAGGLSSVRVQTMIFALWLPFLICAAVDAWGGRHNYAADALSYLDVSDAILNGDWTAAINSYWSPLYPALLAPVIALGRHRPLLEFSLVRIFNLTILLLTAGCYWYLSNQIGRLYFSGVTTQPSRIQILVFAVPIFAWGALNLNAASRVSPDMLVAALFFLLCSVLIRLSRGDTKPGVFVLLGLLAGAGYLAKAVMLSAGALSLLCGLLVSKPSARKWILLSGAVAIAVVAPFIVALSIRQHHLTIGESGKLNYAWNVLRVERAIHWQGGSKEGTPLHPSHVLASNPPIFEFARPFAVHYPPWFDPGYWYAGLRLPQDAGRQFWTFARNVIKLPLILMKGPFGWAIGLTLILLAVSFRTLLPECRRCWFLLVMSATPMLLYCMVVLESRYMMGFAVVLTLVLTLSAVRLYPKATAALALAYWVGMFAFMVPPALRTGHEIRSTRGHIEDDQWSVATDLSRLGLRPDDPVGAIDDTMYAAWPRLARVRVIAEIPYRKNDEPSEGLQQFWSAGPQVKRQTLEILKRAGARAVIARPPGDGVPTDGWIRVGKEGYLFRWL